MVQDPFSRSPGPGFQYIMSAGHCIVIQRACPGVPKPRGGCYSSILGALVRFSRALPTNFTQSIKNEFHGLYPYHFVNRRLTVHLNPNRQDQSHQALPPALHCLPTASQHFSRRFAETGWRVPSCWANKETRYSSSIQRNCSRASSRISWVRQ